MLFAVLLMCTAQTDSSHDAGGVGPRIVQPTVTCDAGVSYPTSELASGITGDVVLGVTVLEDGGTRDVRVQSSLGAAFDSAAKELLETCRFTGATIDDKAASATVEWTVRFVAPVRPWTLEGEVVGELGEPLAEALVSFGGQEVRTSEQGRFVLRFESLPPGESWVTVSKEGYALNAFPEVFRAGQTTSARYALVKNRGFETRVTGSRLLPAVPDADKSPQVSRYSLTRSDIDRTPGALEDIARVVHQLPGVAADPDLLANFFVRGGGPDETIIFIDGVPLSNPYHLGGFASILNPLLIDGADFYAGAAPARYEPSLSGVLDIRYVRGNAKRPKVIADVSMLTAKVRADIPLGIEGLTSVVSFRRSYFEAYFAVLKALRVFGQSVVAPDITEGFARISYQRGQHRTMLTFTHASDGFNFIVKPGEEAFINFAGDLRLANSAQIVSARHEVDLPGDSEFTATAAYLRDQNLFDVQGLISRATSALRNDVLIRSDLKWVFSENNRSSVGVQYAWRQTQLTGSVDDTRGVAPWAQEPIVDNYRPVLAISPLVQQNLLSAYAEHTFRPSDVFAVEGGGRAQYDVSRRQATGSARLAASLTLPSLTVLKTSFGVSYQALATPLQLDPTFGNPGLLPERALSLIAAVEQPLPIEALVRVEGWSKWLSNLVVNPDTTQGVTAREAAGAAVFTNDGTGQAFGVDVQLLGRLKHFSYTVVASGLRAVRTNPLASVVTTYPVQWEQQFSTGGSISWSPNSKWIVTSRVNFRLGRPYTPINSFTADVSRMVWLPVYGSTSSSRYPFFFEVSARAEHRFQWGPLSGAAYFEVMNLTNTTNVFSWVYGAGDFANGVPPDQGRFTHLPIRPFLGIRLEY